MNNTDNPFTPLPDFISPSLNRFRLVALPGIDLPANVAGQLGYDLLSAAALRRMVGRYAAALGLDEGDPQLLPRFDAVLETAVSQQNDRSLAHKIAHEYGRRLGWLLLALKRGDSANRMARPAWDYRHWAWWAQINTIWLGGGMVSGSLGKLAAQIAQAVVRDGGFSEFAVHVSLFAHDLPLYGLARKIPAGTPAALLFDFGHTHVKRALAHSGPAAPAVTVLPALPAPCEPYEYKPWSLALAHRVYAGMLNLMAETWQGLPYAPTLLLVSIATYLYNGHPYPSQANTGCYSRLQTICANLASFLQESVRDRLSFPVTLRLYHDGAAAAAVYTGWLHTAVITIGTSLGIGFPPAAPHLPGDLA